jgi:hypothetical protein
MGWSFRRSIRFGPIRFNLSKSGVGVSAGVKGARVSTGPRGTYVNVGRGGYYYRQKVGGGSRASGAQGAGANVLPPMMNQQLPHNQYPQFPPRGTPRIFVTLLWIVGAGVFILLPVSVIIFVSLSDQNMPKTAQQPPQSPPVVYREFVSYDKGTQHWRNVVVGGQPGMNQTIELARYLHTTSPTSNFNIFDDAQQLDVFIKFETSAKAKPPSTLNAWLSQHQLGRVTTQANSTSTPLWQFTDRQGRVIAPLF